jgi:GNAT superfamily N-acetyltransferase
VSAAPALAEISALDSERWQAVTAKASAVNAAALPAILAMCRTNAVRFLIARCAAENLAAAQAMEGEGFMLMDTLVYFARRLTANLPQDDAAAVAIRPYAPGDEAGVRAVAMRSFSGYMGHYHADARLDRAQCDALYTDWAERSCLSRQVADEVLIGVANGAVVAFATLRLNDTDEGEGVLFGVAPEAQGKGIYRSLMIAGMHWCRGRGRSSMVVSTQVTNIAVQKVWARLGFEPAKAYYTFHKWF